MSKYIFTDDERDEINVRLLSLIIEKYFYSEVKERVLKGTTAQDYLDQEQRLIELYNKNFKKHD